MSAELERVEGTVKTQNSLIEEKALLEAEMEAVVKELKDKKKGAAEKVIVLFEKTKSLMNRFVLEQIKEYKIPKIVNEKTEELKLEGNIEKEKEESSVREIIEEVGRKNSEMVWRI